MIQLAEVQLQPLLLPSDLVYITKPSTFLLSSSEDSAIGGHCLTGVLAIMNLILTF